MDGRRACKAAASCLLVLGCRSTPKADPSLDAAPPPVRVFVLDAASMAASAAPGAADAGEIEEFSSLFEYGAIDAGPGNPGRLAGTTYAAYANPRFHFTVDVPSSFDAMPEPENGDGMQWRLGNLAAMSASGIHASDSPVSCPNSKSVTGHRSGKNTCWSTGIKDGYIYWVHTVRQGDVSYTLQLQYVEALKTPMDPIVKHVSASWSQ